MMSRYRNWMRFVLACGALLLTAPLWAMPPQMGGGFGDGPGGELFFMERMAERLELSDEQRVQVQQLFDKQREESRPFVRTMVKQRNAMLKLMEGDVFDESAARKLVSKQSAAMTELAVIRVRGRFEMQKLLTPEQREKMQHQLKRRMGPEPE
ncbi:MAG: Spy/CpxP family protein refolding chaperone [Gammaproteobacteria bacterium]